MKTCKLALIMAAAVLFISSCNKAVNEPANNVPASPQVAVAATPDQFAGARATFKKNCAGCHGEDGKGGLRTIEGKKLKVPALTEGHALDHTDAEFVKQISNGGDGMPQFKDKLSPQEINDLVRFIRHDFQGK